ncbi:MAG: FAD-binding protein [Aeromicrobium erythreum]
MQTTIIDPAAVAALRRTVRGTVAYPSDAVYETLLTGHNLAVVHRPAVVVEAADRDDVAAAVRVASAHGLRVVVQATGHGMTCAVEDGMVVSTRRLTDVHVRPERRTAVVGAGVTWGALVAAAADHGLAPVPTNGPGVGVVGSVLGGGIGPLSRTHGFCAEHVRSLTVVTADGFERSVGADSELAWALLGGRDGVGVVTTLELALVPAAPIWGGELVFTGGTIPEVLQTWRRLAAQAPDACWTSAAVARVPDVEEVPPPLRGQAALRIAIAALDPSGEALAHALTTDVAPALEALGPLTLRDWLERHGDLAPPMPVWQRGILLVDLTAEAVDLLLEVTGPDSGAPLLGVEVRRLGGATTRPANDAISGRDADWLVNVVAVPDPALFDTVVPETVDRLESALEPWTTGGTQLNFHGAVTPSRPVDLGWSPAVAARLASVRARVDPTNVFAGTRPVLSS